MDEERTGTRLRKLSVYLGVMVVVSVFIAGFIAYFSFSVDPESGVVFDGFGRPLSETPWFITFFFGQDTLWPGWAWFFGDMAIFWGCIFLAYKLADYGFNVEP